MTFDQLYNVNWEVYECLDLVYEILLWLDDIKLALELGESITYAASPSFDSLKTFGKYEH
jgi:hypothetical protein